MWDEIVFDTLTCTVVSRYLIMQHRHASLLD